MQSIVLALPVNNKKLRVSQYVAHIIMPKRTYGAACFEPASDIRNHILHLSLNRVEQGQLAVSV